MLWGVLARREAPRFIGARIRPGSKAVRGRTSVRGPHVLFTFGANDIAAIEGGMLEAEMAISAHGTMVRCLTDVRRATPPAIIGRASHCAYGATRMCMHIKTSATTRKTAMIAHSVLTQIWGWDSAQRRTPRPASGV